MAKDDVLKAVRDLVQRVIYCPQVQFLKDVDGDGEIDHLYCCEAAALNYLQAIGYELDPFKLECEDTYVEWSKWHEGPDAGWGAAILALFVREPLVAGDPKRVYEWAATYRIPVQPVEMNAPRIAPDHDLLILDYEPKVNGSVFYAYCTYNGPCAISEADLDEACVMLSTVRKPATEPPEDPSPSKAAKWMLSSGAPVIATVDARRIAPVAKLGTVPFVVAVEESWRADWLEGLGLPVPKNETDRLCYLDAVLLKDELPVWCKKTEDWWIWLRKNQEEIIPGLRS